MPLINGPVEFSPGAFGKTIKSKFTTEPTKMCKTGDLLICVRGSTTGRTNIAAFDACIGRGVASIRSRIHSRYLNYVILSMRESIYESGTGSTFKSISQRQFFAYPFPLPPLSEQRRIVSKVDGLMSLCDELESRGSERVRLRERASRSCLDRLVSSRSRRDLSSACQRLSDHFEVLYDTPETLAHLRQSILQLAVQGKLVPQDPNDQPADKLLTQIEENRRKLVSQGALKRMPKRRVIENGEAEFELPTTWQWCHVADIATVNLGGTPARATPEYWKGNVRWVSSGEVANCRICDTEEKITQEGLENSNAKVYPSGTVLIAMIGQGKTRGQSAILDVDASTNQNVAGLIFESGCIDAEYVWRWALCEYERTRSGGRGGAQPALNGAKIRALLIPLPPLAEQKRIVAKVDQLLSQCDELCARLRERQSATQQLLTAMIHQLLSGTPGHE